MLPYKRSKRVGDLLKEEIAEIVQRRIKDPRLGFVTVTDVELTDDLKIARVYVSVLDEKERDLALEILNSAKSFVRSEISRRVRLKFMPSIEFRLDTSIEYGSKIDKLLKEIRDQDEPEG